MPSHRASMPAAAPGYTRGGSGRGAPAAAGLCYHRPMPHSPYMPDMTNLEVRSYLEGGGRTVLVPVGSTEDHGDHGPLWTDVYIPLEVCRRAAAELNALVGPPVPFGLAADHRGAAGLVYLRLSTFTAVLRDVCVTLAEAGFRRICLVNGHYVNTWAMQYAASEIHDELPKDVRVFPFPYWQALPPEQAAAYLGPDVGIHANVGETSAILAIDPDLCDMERARDFEPDLGPLTTGPYTVLDPVFLATPGAFHAATLDGGGVWGRPTEATAEQGERFLDWCAQAVVNLVGDMERTHDRLEPHAGRRG
jgi:creatinine amidohydrolase